MKRRIVLLVAALAFFVPGMAVGADASQMTRTVTLAVPDMH